MSPPGGARCCAWRRRRRRAPPRRRPIASADSSPRPTRCSDPVTSRRGARAHAQAMAALHERMPGDPDVAAFYALALLGTMARGLAGAADAHEGHSAALAGSADADARDGDTRAGAARAPEPSRRVALPAAQQRRSRARARWRCRRRAPTPRWRRRRVTRSICRRISSCSSGCGTTPRSRIAPPMPRPMHG